MQGQACWYDFLLLVWFPAAWVCLGARNEGHQALCKAVLGNACSAAPRLTASAPCVSHRVRHLDALRNLSPWARSVSLAFSQWKTSKIATTFRVQRLVWYSGRRHSFIALMETFRGCYSLTNFSFKHELHSQVFISFTFFVLFPSLPVRPRSGQFFGGGNTMLSMRSTAYSTKSF